MQVVKIGLPALWLLTGCQAPDSAATQPPVPPAVVAAPVTDAKPTSVGMGDSLDLCYSPFPQKSSWEFARVQRLPFRRSIDTLVNDERGLFLGPKFTLGNSYVLWDDENRTVRRLFIDDPRWALSHGLRVRAPQGRVLQQVGWRGRRTTMPDTLYIECGYLSNSATLVFRQGRLASVALENEAD